ncbi:MAG TPA: AAA family ATPase [Candidatus Elarobacter sp.]|jgi:DNA-binding SARP family transcriptional activator
MLQVRLFGHPRIALDGVPASGAARPKVVPLLAYLLLHRDAPRARRQVANALWPDASEEDARANLRRHLNYLQNLLPPKSAERPWIIGGAAHLRWNPGAELDLDIAEFERLAALPHRVGDAVALYAGELLAGVDEDWVEPHRERFRSAFQRALAELIASARASGDHALAIASAQRLLAADPWREDALRALMTVRFETGDRAGGLAEYERFARALRDELGAEPMPETRAVYDALVRDQLPAAPRAAAEAPPPRGETLRALPFIGRGAELAMLDECRRAAAGGRGTLVLVGGEAGIGKTRLVRELAASAEAHGAQVYLAATGQPEAIPYQPFADLLRAAAPLLPHLAVEPLWLAAVSALAPAVAQFADELPPLPAVDAARERGRLFEACADVFEALRARRPLVLIVEDVHAAGAATLALLEYLGRRAAGAGTLIVATYREDELELTHQLRAIRRRLEHEGAALHLALPRLTRDAVEELVRALADADEPDALASVLHARSEGNPFFLGEILRDLGETGRLRIVERRWSYDGSPANAVPPAVRGALDSRLARLDDAAKALAETAATIGRAFGAELLRETTGWLESDVLDALETLIDRRIVGEHGGGASGEYAFTHSLVQTVLYDAIPEKARARRHRRVAHVMSQLYAEQRDDVAAALALHWERGNEPELAAGEYVRAARRALSVYANEEADAHLARALELGTERRLRFDALLLRERVAAARGDRAAQLRDAGELARLAREIDDEDAICTVLDRRVELANVTSERRLERVLLRLLERRVRRSGDARWTARALEARARYLRSCSEFDAARAAFAELIALTARTGDHGTLAAARLAVADTYIYEGRLAEAAEALAELRAAVEASANQSALVRTLMAFARTALVQQDYAAMSRFAEEAHATSRAIGDREGEALALHTLANGLVYTFRVGEARERYERARELYERIGHRVGIASIGVDLGLFHTELGLLDRALELYANAREVAAEIGFRWVLCVEAVDRSYAHRLRGAFADARSAAESALVIARELRSPPLVSAALGTLGAAESALGAHADAIAHLEEGVALRRPAGQTPRLGENLCALALAHVRAGDAEAARRAADELLDLYEANPKLAPQPSEWLWAAAQVELLHERFDVAQGLLRRAGSVMRARAAAIDDAATRAAYLALPFNRAVAEALGCATRPLTDAPRRRG